MNEVSLWTIFKSYLHIGWQGWGGPVAQIQIIQEHAVEQNKWIDQEQFRDAYAICTMLPGPEAAELCIYIGTHLRGRWGGLVAGLGFMLPNFVLITLFAWLYFAYAVSSDVIALLLFGVKPTMIAIVAYSLYRLSVKFGVWQSYKLPIVMVLMFMLSLFTTFDSVIGLLMLGALYAWLETSIHKPENQQKNTKLYSVHPLYYVIILFFKIGALSFGGAYTVLALLQFEAVDQYAWLTTAQYLDGLAINELIPGPLIMVAAFVGYAAYGWLGALLATVFIFLPAFLLVLYGMPVFTKLRRYRWVTLFLTGVGAAVVGLTASFIARLSIDVLQDWGSPLLMIGSLYLLAKWKFPIWLVFLIGISAGTIYGLSLNFID